MALVECPDCGKNISDAAPACIHCGRPMTVLAPRISEPKLEPTLPTPRTSGAQYACPNCGGGDVRKLALVHGSGFSSVQLETAATGVGLSGGGLGVGVASASTSGTQQTALSKTVAPPAQRKPTNAGAGWGCGIVVLAVAFALGSSSSWVLLVGVLAAAIVMAVVSRNEKREIDGWNGMADPEG